MKSSSKAVSTTIVIVIIVVLLVAAIAGIYLASQNHSTSTTTIVSTTTQTGSGSTVTTTLSSSSSTSSGSIPPNEIIDGIVSPQWQGSNIGDDVQASWSSVIPWFSNNYEQLFAYDPSAISHGTYAPVPWLAKNYTESADGLTYTINLQQGVKFHSGNAMTSTDVLYSFYRFQLAHNQSANFATSPAGGLEYSDTFASMKSIVAAGPYQVVLTLNYPDPNILSELSNQGFSIVDSKLLQAHTVVTGTGANATSDWGFAWLDSGTGGTDAGTGPYVLTSFTYEQRMELQSFSGYWGGPFGNYTSKVNTIIYLPYSDATTAQFALQQGQINMVQDETPDSINNLAHTTGITTNTSPGFLWMNLYMHPVGPLADWRVRDAIKITLDTNTISKTITDGYDKPDASFFGIGFQGYSNTTANFFANQAPNASGAAKLLAAAGYPHGFSTNLYTRPGSRFGIAFASLSSVIVSELAAINITVSINVYVVGQFYNLLQNLTLPGMWTVPSSLIILSPISNIEEGLGNGNTLYMNWNAQTETGPGVPFTQMNQLFNESLTAPTATLALGYETTLDTIYQQYGDTMPILEAANTVGYSSAITGVVWNSLTDSFLYEYIST